MIRQPLTMFCYVDISGQVRGKGFPAHLLKKRLQTGIAWTPTNIMITALGPIADTPWGPFDDLILMPDPSTEVLVDFEDGWPAEHFFLSDVMEPDGTPWSACPRAFLRSVLARVRAEAGLVPMVSFEHEFVYTGADARPGDGYALDAIRRHGAFGEVFLAALHKAGLAPDSYLPEYGEGQFEVTVPPAAAQLACDQAVTVKELARATAYRLGSKATFSPKTAAGSVGNGVHLHISLWDTQGRAITFDPAGPGQLSPQASRFVAGVQRHLPALCAFTAPTPPSYLRLQPHSWSAAWSNVGYRDREAAIRICPVFETWSRSAAEQFNVEYRVGDAAANPYLQLAMVLRAGLEGIRDQRAMPAPTTRDPEVMSDDERDAGGIVRLPQSLEAALTAVQTDDALRGWLPPPLLEAYLRYKTSELDLVKNWDTDTLCEKYAEVY